MKVLLVAGRTPLAAKVEGALVGAGWELEVAATGAAAGQAARTGRPDVVVYDPDVAHAGFAARLRRDAPTVPLVALLPASATDRAADELEAGAIDVLTPGMGGREVLVRLGNGVARGAVVPDSGAATIGDLVVDAEAGRVTWAGATVELTGRERSILHALVAHAGQPLQRERLYRIVWGYTMARGDRIVDVNIKRLRGKLGAATGGEVEIVTRPGVGYGIGLRQAVAIGADAVPDESEGAAAAAGANGEEPQ